MSAPQLLLFLLIVIFLVLPAIGLCLLFRKAGVPGWKAFVPVYSSYVMLSISDRPRYWILLQFVPVIGLFFSVAIAVEFIKTFGKRRFYQQALVFITAGLYFLYIGLRPADQFKGPDETKQQPGRWIGVGLVTVLFIALLRTFVFESYSIPTMSMEKTMLMGDMLLVNKLSYGPRIPITPLSIPYIPGVIPSFLKDAYSKTVQLPYHRLFSSPVSRGDIMVFNFPEGDTVIALSEYQSMHPYYDVIRELGAGNADSGRKKVLDDPDQYPLAIIPVDKREAWLKRCVAIPGDMLEVRDQVVYIDGRPQPLPPEEETYFRVITNGQPLDEATMKEQWGLDINNTDDIRSSNSANEYTMHLTWGVREKMLKDGMALRITPEKDTAETGLFPNDSLHHWTMDSYGPLWIPQKGATLQLTSFNYSIYERAIRTYEGNKLEIRNGKIYLNDREQSRYTFKMNYYWVVGDNLHGSLDSRIFGFVPEDHVIGKAWLIWASWEKGMRWNRMFKKPD